MLHFCTLFDHHYLSRGIALLDSLNSHCPHFTLFILCLDDKTYQTLKRLNHNNSILIELATLEKHDTALLNSKNNRSLIEYYFTLSPCLPLYIIENVKPSVDCICSIDSDLYFFDDPSVIFKDFSNFSILITEHYLNEEIKNNGAEKYGKYNVSFQIFRHDETGISCLKRWKRQCIDWCYDYLDKKNHRFADQLYLETWVKDYPNKVKIITPNTEGVAPWNLNRCQLTIAEGKIYSNGAPLIYYHFHGLRLIDPKWVANRLFVYKTQLTHIIKFHLYLPYILNLKSINQKLEYLTDTDTSIRYNFSSISKFLKIIKHRSVFYLYNDSKMIAFNFSLLGKAVKGLEYTIDKFKKVVCRP